MALGDLADSALNNRKADPAMGAEGEDVYVNGNTGESFLRTSMGWVNANTWNVHPIVWIIGGAAVIGLILALRRK
jgi:hypothetical protein